MASQRGVPDADTPDYATLICSAFTDEVSSAITRITHELLANMVTILLDAGGLRKHNSWARVLGLHDFETLERRLSIDQAL